MWRLELHSSSGQWWQLSLGSLFLLFQHNSPCWGRTPICTRTGAAKGLFPLEDRVCSHRCVQFMEPFPGTEAEQVCRACHPQTSNGRNVPPSPLQPVPCPGRFYPALLTLPSYRASQVASAGCLYWISSHQGLLSIPPACFPNSSYLSINAWKTRTLMMGRVSGQIGTPDPQRLVGMGSLEEEGGWLRGQDRVELNSPFQSSTSTARLILPSKLLLSCIAPRCAEVFLVSPNSLSVI